MKKIKLKNDRELLFALLCHYKYALQNSTLKDGWLQITKKKHTTVKKSGQKKKVPIRYNMNAIMNMVGAKSYANSFERFVGSGLVQIVENKTIKIKMDIECSEDDKLIFEVKDIYNPYVYLTAYEQGSKLTECVICGKDFIKSSNNQKTCGEECHTKLQKFNVTKNNEKMRTATQQGQKKAI